MYKRLVLVALTVGTIASCSSSPSAPALPTPTPTPPPAVLAKVTCCTNPRDSVNIYLTTSPYGFIPDQGTKCHIGLPNEQGRELEWDGTTQTTNVPVDEVLGKVDPVTKQFPVTCTFGGKQVGCKADWPACARQPVCNNCGGQPTATPCRNCGGHSTPPPTPTPTASATPTVPPPSPTPTTPPPTPTPNQCPAVSVSQFDFTDPISSGGTITFHWTSNAPGPHPCSIVYEAPNDPANSGASGGLAGSGTWTSPPINVAAGQNVNVSIICTCGSNNSESHGVVHIN